MSIIRNKGLLASVGVVTATAATVGGFAPAMVSAGAADSASPPAFTPSDSTTSTTLAPGTYESCSAYFGYGKSQGSSVDSIDITTFPVTVEGGAPVGPAPTVGNGAIDVVLVLTDIDGKQLRCVPQEVTKAEWDATWGGALQVNIPAWPGPGHYAYPSIPPAALTTEKVGALSPPAQSPAAIGGLGDLASVGFEVTSVPDGYTLVAPVQIETLPQSLYNFLLPYLSEPPPGSQLSPPPQALQIIEAAAGAAGVAEYTEALNVCVGFSGNPPNADNLDLVAAVQALQDLVSRPGQVPVIAAPVSCDEVTQAYIYSVFIFAVEATIATKSPITVSLPVPETTTIPAAQPAQVTPAFTG